MATRTINTKIQLDGEKEFKKAVSDINSGLGVLNSEMKKVTAQYQGNADSVEALRAKNDVLERTLSTQKDKVEELRKALANSAEKYGEADTRTMKWQKSLNEAEAAVYNTEQAIKDNNQAIEEANGKGSSLSGLVDGLVDKFGDKLPSGVKESLSSIGGFSAGAVAAVGAVAAAVTALIATYKKLFDIVKEQASEAGELEDLGQIIGLDVESVQEYQYAAELIGTSFDTIQGSMTKMKRNMQSAQEGNADLSASFSKLGVSVTDADGNLRNSEDVFWEIIDALGKVENVTERDTLAMDLLGKSAEDLNPLIVQGKDAFQEYCEEAENLGTVMSTDTVSALAAVDDAYLKLQETQDGVKEQIAGEMAPAVEEFYTAWADFTKTVGQAIIDSGILDSLSNILHYFSNLISEMGNAETAVPTLVTAFETLSTVLRTIAQMAASVVDLFNAIANFNLYGIISGKFGDALGLGYSEGRANNAQTVRLMWEGNYDQYTEYYAGKNASGDSNWRGGLTWVGENGAELVNLPQGSQIYSAQESRELAGGDTYNITIDAKSVKEFNDIVKIAKNSRMTARAGGVG